MAKSYVIKDEREYPDYEFREYPKHLGFDADGLDIEVKDEDEEIARLSEVVYPKTLGKDRNGKDVIAMGPTEEGWKSKLVIAPKEEKIEEEKMPPETLEIKRGPGRPPKGDAAS